MKELIKTLWKHKIACLIIIAVSIYNKILEIVTTMTGKRSFIAEYVGIIGNFIMIPSILFILYSIGKTGCYKNIVFVVVVFIMNQFICYDRYDTILIYSFRAIFFLIAILGVFHLGYGRSPLIKDTLKGNLVCYSTIVIWIVLWVFLLILPLWLFTKLSCII